MNKELDEIKNEIRDIKSDQMKQAVTQTKMGLKLKRDDLKVKNKRPHGDQEASFSSIAESDEENKNAKSSDDLDRKALVERVATLEEKLQTLIMA